MKAKELYSVGVYLRLSRDDEDLVGNAKSESNSISSQRELIRSFIKEHKDMEIFDIYVDDGFSGANFNRPEFKRMLEDVKAKKVDCIIVKDLSRFGRDYIEAGRLIQKTFPAFHVRFIAITDHYDSLTADYNETSLVLPVKNFVNDSYCRDISGKVKSQQKVKREKGEFIGAFTVYGYCKDKENKNKLVPDRYAAQIVRNIFAWKMDGMSTIAIAHKLDEMGILSPLEYKKSKGENLTTCFAAHMRGAWSAVAVKRILVNEMYTGTMVQGKKEKVNYKLQKYIEKPAEDWIRVKDTHEAVISREDFNIVQRLLAIDSRASGNENKAHIFSGLLFCGDCGEPMVRRINKYKGIEKIYFICPTRNKSQGCTRHSILEVELKEVVLSGLQSQAALLTDEMKILSNIEKLEINFDELTRFDQEMVRLHKEGDKYLSLRSFLYEDMKSGILSQDDYVRFRENYDEQYAKIQEAIAKQEEMIQALFRSGISIGMRLERFKEVLDLSELNRDLLLSFIEKILVFEDKRICMELKQKEMYSKIIMLSEYVKSETKSDSNFELMSAWG